MKRINKLIALFAMFLFAVMICPNCNMNTSFAYSDECLDCYTVFNLDDADEILFMRGGKIEVGDEYISADNKLYYIEVVDEEERVGHARFIENVKMPVYNITKNNEIAVVNAATNKKVGMYHTHNDECYNDADGTDSVYGKGGIHDVGAKLKSNFESLGIEVVYDESLHLPHDSGAYTRSQATASKLLRDGVDAIFDVHRDATPRSEYITKVDGESMSKVRMVVGKGNANSGVNKEFALNIKAYADEVYPGLIKDIYIGKGNYNQQLSERAMLFEMGTNTIEKALVVKSTLPLAKTLDVVLFGTNNASKDSLKDINTPVSSEEVLSTGMVGAAKSGNETAAGLSALAIAGIILGSVALIFALIMIISKKARNRVVRFFKEMFAIGKHKSNI